MKWRIPGSWSFIVVPRLEQADEHPSGTIIHTMAQSEYAGNNLGKVVSYYISSLCDLLACWYAADIPGPTLEKEIGL
jgi:hypothetical protein